VGARQVSARQDSALSLTRVRWPDPGGRL